MKTFTRMAAQGDLMIIRIGAIPDTAKPAKREGNQFVLAHSETGHHHVVQCDGVEVLDDPDDAFRSFMRVALDDGAVIEHQRSFDTHEALLVPPGDYEIRRQREYTPEGFRRAAD